MNANPGDIVQLAAFEDQPRQVAVVLRRTPVKLVGHPQMLIVQLRPEDRDPPGTYEDGIRELAEEQIESILWRDQ